MIDPNKHGMFNKDKKLNWTKHIKIGLSLITVVSLYNVLTTYNTTIFGISVFLGIFSTLMLLNYNDLS